MKFQRLKKSVWVMFYGLPKQDINGVEYEVQVWPGSDQSLGSGVMQKWVMSPSFERPAGGNPINIEDPQYEQYIADNLIETKDY